MCPPPLTSHCPPALLSSIVLGQLLVSLAGDGGNGGGGDLLPTQMLLFIAVLAPNVPIFFLSIVVVTKEVL